MKTLLTSLFITLFASFSFAGDFNPKVMTLSVPPEIGYKFDDSNLTIPFTLGGTSAALWLVINTHGQADNIVGGQKRLSRLALC